MAVDLRTAITENSIWKFDMDLKRYVRFPKSEVPAPTEIPYTMEWDDFDFLSRHEDTIIVFRPVPLGKGRMRMTSRVVWDDLGELDV